MWARHFTVALSVVFRKLGQVCKGRLLVSSSAGSMRWPAPKARSTDTWVESGSSSDFITEPAVGVGRFSASLTGGPWSGIAPDFAAPFADIPPMGTIEDAAAWRKAMLAAAEAMYDAGFDDGAAHAEDSAHELARWIMRDGMDHAD